MFSLGNSERAQGKSYPLCPYCYNNPPFDGMGEMGCDRCLHPLCQHSLLFHGVCRCPGEPTRAKREGMGRRGGRGGEPSRGGEEEGERKGACNGMLVLDPNSKPNWKLACNRCNCIARIQGDIHQLTVSRVRRSEVGNQALAAARIHAPPSIAPPPSRTGAPAVAAPFWTSSSTRRRHRWMKAVRSTAAA